MSRALLIAAFATATFLTAVGAARAEVPIVGAPAATNIQGISALLVDTVDPQGLSTVYHFEYVDQPNFTASGFATATATSSTTVGPGGGEHHVNAAIGNLHPDTFYRTRLVATNSSGTSTSGSAPFRTTHGFGFLPGTEGFAVSAIDGAGAGANEAGSHPYQLGLKIGLEVGGEFEGQPGTSFPDGDIRDLEIEAPPGFLFNPDAVPKCTLVDFHRPRVSPYEASRSGESCPNRTQIGTVDVETSLGGGESRRFGVFNLQPPPGIAMQLGFAPFGAPIVLDGNLLTGADASYTLVLRASNISQRLDLHGLALAIWGTPWAQSHNSERGNCLDEGESGKSWESFGQKEIEEEKEPCNGSIGKTGQECEGKEACAIPLAYLTLPHRCSGPLSFAAKADAWQQPAEASATAVNRNAKGQQVEMRSCLGVDFEPTPSGYLTTSKTATSTGYNFRLSADNEKFTIPEFPAPAPTRQAIVTLPEGVTINPSVGAGLGVCTPAQYAAEAALSREGEACPNASKIGDFQVDTPLFEEFVRGAIYLAQPDDPTTSAPGAENPFDTLLAVYLVARIPNRAILIKLAGEIAIDPGTGQLTATFEGLPQLPYTNLEINFRSGQRAPLISPSSCGPATTTMNLTPWVGSLSVHETSVSPIEKGLGGGPCPTGAAPPYSPHVIAGGVNSNVNSYTPYFVHISRQDSEQEITSYSLVLPKGITAKLAGIPFCPDAAIAAARLRRGHAEAINPSCPAASQVGRTLSGYGVGGSLTYAEGRIYLAGPYHGAPLSLVTINSATVGPLDLGTIVIRSAFQVDPLTAQLRLDSSASDPIPHILDGVPLHLRDIRIYMDRPEFTHSPSSCAPSELISTLTGAGASFENPADDSTTTATSYFQLLNCRTLGFQPQLGLRLRGGTKRRAFPQLRAAFVSRGPEDSNLKEIAVTIPHQEFLAQEHIEGICSKAQFNADSCPADSVYGSAVAYTPLLDDPLRGNVYLRSNPEHAIPDLVASLHSGAVKIVLEGRIGPGKKGGIEAYFSELPDQPLTRFVMTLFGGKRGLLQNSADICAVPPVASVKALAQNDIGAVFTTKLRGKCRH